MTDLDDIERDLTAARAALLASLEGVTLEEIARRPPGPVSDDEQRWPIVEVVWHVGLTEDRFRLTIDQVISGREVTPAAPRVRPAHMTTATLLHEWLMQTRQPTEALLRRMQPADLDREYVRPDGAKRTPRQLLAIIVQHDRDHAEQVRTLRALPAQPAEA